jgi:hypothetical protein
VEAFGACERESEKMVTWDADRGGRERGDVGRGERESGRKVVTWNAG